MGVQLPIANQDDFTPFSTYMKNIFSTKMHSLSMLGLAFVVLIVGNIFGAQALFSVSIAAAATKAQTGTTTGSVVEGTIVDPANPAKSGVAVELRDAAGSVLDTQISDAGGFFQFSPTSTAFEVCVVANPTVYSIIDPISGCKAVTVGDVGAFTVSTIPIDTTLHISGTVRLLKGSPRELPFSLVTIEVRDVAGTFATTTVPERGGTYSISVPRGRYAACVIPPGGYAVVSSNACQNTQSPEIGYLKLNDVSLGKLPTITRNGDATLDVDYQSSYIDAGATAALGEQDLTALIRVSGLPDTTIPALYVITYVVTVPDSELSATTTRVVTVKPAPQRSSVIGGYIGGASSGGGSPQNPPSVLAPTTTTTVASDQDASSTAKKIIRETLRKRALGAVLGAETVSTNTPTSTISTSTSGPKIPNQERWGWLRALLALLAFAAAIFGLWLWKKKVPTTTP